MALSRNRQLAIFWLFSSIVAAAVLATVMFAGNDKTVFLPGDTTWGHHQIEMQCGSCHGDSFTDPMTLQNACMDCHGEELEVAQDSHPRSKFTDPRNADRLEKVDARQCISCHTEHRPEMTHAMGVTLPTDYCAWCHEDIAEDRPSHAGMGFDTCASAGCHNYHDNRALYEDFLLKHTQQASMPDLHMRAMPIRNLASYLDWKPAPAGPVPASATADPGNDYAHTIHDQAGISCASCHGAGEEWVASPEPAQCGSCHENELEGFKQGKHGMRLAVGLGPMTPALARLPMHQERLHDALTCNSCHAGHEFDTVKAATESCLSCHADDHSQAFPDSPHGELWQQALAGDIATAEAVSCATCHMPRINKNDSDGAPVIVQHNQNDTLRPNEKMIRPVCLNCHELQFSLDALADEMLIRNNFSGQPSMRVESIDMAEERSRTRDKDNSVY